MSNYDEKIRKELDELALDKVNGGKGKSGSGGVCPFCNQEYSGDWGSHMTKDCPNNPDKK